MIQYGLKEEQITAIQNILAQHEEVEQAILFGSRAKGNYKPASDIDLILKGEKLNITIQNKIANELDDLLLPYIFDLSVFHQISNQELLEHIDRVGVIVYDQAASDWGKWKSMTLGEVCIKITDGAHFSPKDDPSGLPMASVKDLTRFGVNINSCRRISKEDFGFLVKQGCSPIKGDVLIAKDGNTSLDTVCVYNQDDDIVLLSSVAILRPNRKIVSSDFLNYFLDNPDTRNFLKDNFRSGSAIPRVILRDFRNVSIDVPNLKIQHSISTILRRLDDKIELNRQTNQTLEEIAKMLFQEMCVPKGDELPEGWKVGKLGDVCYVQNGFAFKSQDFIDRGEERIIKIKNISDNVVNVKDTDYVLSKTITKLDKKFMVNSGSLLIAMTGAEVGKIGLVPYSKEQLWLNQRVGNFIEKIRYAKYYLYILLISEDYQNVLFNSAQGSAQPNISSTTIESIAVILPPKSVIDKFGNIVTPIFTQILENIKQNQTLIDLRENALSKLMNPGTVL